MTKGKEKLLLEEEGLKLSESTITAPNGDIPLADVRSVSRQISKPLLIPVLLAMLGTLNLAFAMQTGHADMFVAAGLMLGAGLWFWFRGKRHVVAVQTSAGEQRVWYTKDEKACERVLEVLKEQIQRR